MKTMAFGAINSVLLSYYYYLIKVNKSIKIYQPSKGFEKVYHIICVRLQYTLLYHVIAKPILIFGFINIII